MNLDGIRERSRKCEVARDAAPNFVSDAWVLAAIASAADVPALIAEIERLRSELEQLRAQVGGYRNPPGVVFVTAELEDEDPYVPIPPQEHGAC